MKAHLLLVASTFLAGCSNSPSGGDIEKVLEAAVGPCQNVEVVDVKKTNGYEEDGYYRVEYKFGLEVKEKAKLRKLYEEWRAEYEQFKARRKASDEYVAQRDQLGKEAEALREAAAGPRPDKYNFTSFQAYSDTRDDWEQRGDEAAKAKMQEIKELRQQWEQRQPPNYVVVGKEPEVTGNFFYAGCPQGVMQYISAAIPDMPRDSYGLPYPESRLSFTRADLTGKMSMRKTENGWRKI